MLLDIAEFDEGVPGGEALHDKGRGLREGPFVWDFSYVGSRDVYMGGIGTKTGEAVDRVALLEGFCVCVYVFVCGGADGVDCARVFEAGDEGAGRGGGVEADDGEDVRGVEAYCLCVCVYI